MKSNLRLSLILAGLAGAAAMTGCSGLNIPGTTPSATPEASATPVTPASRIQGRLTWNSADPGVPLTFKLKTKTATSGSWVKFPNDTTPATYSTTTTGAFDVGSLPDAQYQVVYDDEGKVASAGFNTVGLAVSDPVTVSAAQTVVPTANMELKWDFETNIVPAPNTKPSSGFSFTFNAPAGFATPWYQVSVFPTSNTSSGAMNPTATSSVTPSISSAGLSLTPDTTYYYVVKFIKTGGTFGGGNFYGQTKPIPFTAP